LVRMRLARSRMAIEFARQQAPGAHPC
jgi:hypothetical protein